MRIGTLRADCRLDWVSLRQNIDTVFSFCRGMGDVFREWYSRIGQLCSLLPSSTPVLALTATATNDIRNKIIRKLQMQSCTLIEESPDRPNIRYSVVC